MNVKITLTTAGTDTGPFNLYSNTDSYVTAFQTGIAKSLLVAGYTSTVVPAGTNTIRVKSTGTCTNFVDLYVAGTPTTTTTSTTAIPTTTTTTTAIGVGCKTWYFTNSSDPGPAQETWTYTQCNGSAGTIQALPGDTSTACVRNGTTPSVGDKGDNPYTFNEVCPVTTTTTSTTVAPTTTTTTTIVGPTTTSTSTTAGTTTTTTTTTPTTTTTTTSSTPTLSCYTVGIVPGSEAGCGDTNNNYENWTITTYDQFGNLYNVPSNSTFDISFTYFEQNDTGNTGPETQTTPITITTGNNTTTQKIYTYYNLNCNFSSLCDGSCFYTRTSLSVSSTPSSIGECPA